MGPERGKRLMRGILGPMRIASSISFARPDAEAAWHPDDALLADARAAEFVRRLGIPDLDAVQARAVTDPAWFWSAAADDLGLAWQRRPTTVLDVSRGVPFARWWGGGAFNYAAASVDGLAASRPTDEAVAWE